LQNKISTQYNSNQIKSIQNNNIQTNKYFSIFLHPHLVMLFTERQHYRLYTIHKIPSLKVLDFQKIKDAERAKARRLAMSSAGAALEGDVQIEAREAAKNEKDDDENVNTFIPGQGQSAKESFVVNFTKEQKIEIKNMIANAHSPAEIERIEKCVKRGEFPGAVDATSSTATT
jgi:U2 small nuclear ribonucleoprotein A'